MIISNSRQLIEHKINKTIYFLTGSRLILETASDSDQAENGKIVDYIISSGNI